MDWARAKTVMLVAFLLLNVLLLQQLHAQRTGAGLLVTALSRADIQQARAQLEELGVSLNIRIPRDLVSLPRLMVRSRSVQTDTLPQEFLGTDYLQVAKYVGVNAYQHPDGDELLVLWNDGRGYYGPTRRQGFGLTGELCGWIQRYILRMRGQAFMSSYAFLDGNWRFDYAVDLGDNHQAVVFVQEFGGYRIFGSYVVVWFADRQPLGLSWSVFEIMGFTEPERAVWPASEGLLVAAHTDILPPGSVVEGIRLGYFVELTDAVSWESVPVWRLLLAGGQQVLINGYTGEVEVGPSWVNVDGGRSLTGP